MSKKDSYIAIFSGVYNDISQFDFSKLNLRFTKLTNPELKLLINKIELRENWIYDTIEDIKKEGLIPDYMYALIPLNFSKEVEYETYEKIRDILKLIFPSDVTLHFVIEITYDEDYEAIHSYFSSEFDFSPSNRKNAFDNFLKFNEENLNEINEFIKLYLTNHQNIKYIQSSIHSYSSSYLQNFQEMKFLNLCIALESIVNGTNELNYRIRRNVSILVGTDINISRKVFKNIGKIYSLRSKIVHSGNYDSNKIEEYLPYLIKLTSRLIIEIISHNIQNLDELNQALTESGFGQHKSLSKNYKFYELNTLIDPKSLSSELP